MDDNLIDQLGDSMVLATETILANPKILENYAKILSVYKDCLMKEGFTEIQAQEILRNYKHS